MPHLKLFNWSTICFFICFSFTLIAYLLWHSCVTQDMPFSHMVDDRIYWLVLRDEFWGIQFISGSMCECGCVLKLATCSLVAGWYQSLRLSGRNKWDRESVRGGGVRKAIVARTDNPMQHLEQSSNTTIMSWPFLPHADISDSSNNSISHTFSPCLLGLYSSA